MSVIYTILLSTVKLFHPILKGYNYNIESQATEKKDTGKFISSIQQETAKNNWNATGKFLFSKY